MTLPTRLVQAVRPAASPGVMGSAAVVAATFAATPFLLPEVAGTMGVDIGRTGLLSTAQVGSFALATFFAGRLFRPRRRLHYGSLALIAVSTVASALAVGFPMLVATRVVAGVGMGTLTWIAWADATRFERGLGDVAAVAPITATVASPLLAALIEIGGFPLVYGALAVMAAGAVLLPVDFGDLPRVGRRVSGSRSNRVLLAALFLLTVGGSSVFIFTGAIAQSVQSLDPVAVSWALSLNALTGVAATRRVATKGTGGLWLLGTVVPAVVIGLVESALAFFVVLAVWGFAYWMAVPAVLRLLAERSLSPSERMGDAQAAMAAGRVLGPVVGGVALAAGQFARLTVVGAGVMLASAAVIGVVEWHRAGRGPFNQPARP